MRLGKALKNVGGDVVNKFCEEFVVGSEGTLIFG